MSLTRKVAYILLTVTLLSSWFFYTPSTPLTDDEVDNYVQRIQAQQQDPGGRHDIDQLRAFLLEDDGKPFYTFNLYKFNGDALYNNELEQSVTGVEAYAKFSSVMVPLLLRNKSYPIFGSNWLGWSPNQWDRIVIVRYANRKAMAEIFAQDEFADASKHKWASIAKHDRFVVQATHLPELSWLLLFTIAMLTVGLLLTAKRQST